jgi:hypothetical protein
MLTLRSLADFLTIKMPEKERPLKNKKENKKEVNVYGRKRRRMRQTSMRMRGISI